jgi:hypothetical protein
MNIDQELFAFLGSILEYSSTLFSQKEGNKHHSSFNFNPSKI